ncbi:MAG: UpxY family transcription antiterminator [Balneolales bacterium]
MNWYALYTRPRFEKKVLKELEELGYEAYLPIKRELRQWSDRKKWIEEPLIRSYVFIKTEPKQLPLASQVNGVACPVTFNGRPATIRAEEIKAIRMIISGPDLFDVEEISFTKGEPVSIIEGPLKGLKGNWINYRGGQRVAIRIDQLQKDIIVEVPTAYVKKEI